MRQLSNADLQNRRKLLIGGGSKNRCEVVDNPAKVEEAFANNKNLLAVLVPFDLIKNKAIFLNYFEDHIFPINKVKKMFKGKNSYAVNPKPIKGSDIDKTPQDGIVWKCLDDRLKEGDPLTSEIKPITISENETNGENIHTWNFIFSTGKDLTNAHYDHSGCSPLMYLVEGTKEWYLKEPTAKNIKDITKKKGMQYRSANDQDCFVQQSAGEILILRPGTLHEVYTPNFAIGLATAVFFPKLAGEHACTSILITESILGISGGNASIYTHGKELNWDGSEKEEKKKTIKQTTRAERAAKRAAVNEKQNKKKKIKVDKNEEDEDENEDEGNEGEGDIGSTKLRDNSRYVGNIADEFYEVRFLDYIADELKNGWKKKISKKFTTAIKNEIPRTAGKDNAGSLSVRLVIDQIYLNLKEYAEKFDIEMIFKNREKLFEIYQCAFAATIGLSRYGQRTETVIQDADDNPRLIEHNINQEEYYTLFVALHARYRNEMGNHLIKNYGVGTAYADTLVKQVKLIRCVNDKTYKQRLSPSRSDILADYNVEECKHIKISGDGAAGFLCKRERTTNCGYHRYV